MRESSLRRWFVSTRDGKEINRVDIVALSMILAGTVFGFVGFLWTPAQFGFAVAVLGFLLLVRDHPGGA